MNKLKHREVTDAEVVEASTNRVEQKRRLLMFFLKLLFGTPKKAFITIGSVVLIGLISFLAPGVISGIIIGLMGEVFAGEVFAIVMSFGFFVFIGALCIVALCVGFVVLKNLAIKKAKEKNLL